VYQEVGNARLEYVVAIGFACDQQEVLPSLQLLNQFDELEGGNLFEFGRDLVITSVAHHFPGGGHLR